MNQFGTTAMLLGGSWATGMNMYLTAAIMGIGHRMGHVVLPGEMEMLAHPAVIAVAVVLYGVEFFADKIPYVDSVWDSVHTFIRPAGGVALGYMAMAGAPAAMQYPVALLTGTIALDAHLTKATARAAINTSPEPISNSIASVTEDVSVAGIMYLIVKHPVIASIIAVLLILFSIWFLKTMFKFLKRIFKPAKKGEAPESAASSGGLSSTER